MATGVMPQGIEGYRRDSPRLYWLQVAIAQGTVGYRWRWPKALFATGGDSPRDCWLQVAIAQGTVGYMVVIVQGTEGYRWR